MSEQVVISGSAHTIRVDLADEVEDPVTGESTDTLIDLTGWSVSLDYWIDEGDGDGEGTKVTRTMTADPDQAEPPDGNRGRATYQLTASEIVLARSGLMRLRTRATPSGGAEVKFAAWRWVVEPE